MPFSMRFDQNQLLRVHYRQDSAAKSLRLTIGNR